MRTTAGLTGHSTSGVWVVQSGDRLIGPFNGRSPAGALAADLRRDGYAATTVQLWSPAEAREAVSVSRFPRGVKSSSR